MKSPIPQSLRLNQNVLSHLRLLAAAVLAANSAVAANSLLDANGTAPGFWDGSSAVTADLTTTTTWTTDTTGIASPVVFPTGNGIQIGSTASDFNGATITVNMSYSGGSMGVNPGVFNIVATNATVTMSGTANCRWNHAFTWTVPAGSTLIVTSTGNNHGFNFNSQTATLAGGGIMDFQDAFAANGNAAGGVTINMPGGTVKLEQTATSNFGAGSAAGCILTAGTLQFLNATALADAFQAFLANAKLTINGGTIDNLSGAPGTIALGSGTYSLGGSFTFTGSSDLNFGNNAVALTATPTVTVSAGTLTIGGAISGGGFGLIKAGNGTLLLGGANTYSGNTIVNAGTLALTNTANLNGSSQVAVNSATLDLSGLTVAAGANPIFSLTNALLVLAPQTGGTNEAAATLNLGGTTNILNIASLPPVTSYPAHFHLIKYTTLNGGFSLGLGSLPNASPAFAGYLTNIAASGLVDLVLNSGPAPARALNWAGTDPSNPTYWDVLFSVNWTDTGNGSIAANYNQGDVVRFDDAATGPTTINVTTTVTPGTLTVSNNNRAYTFNGSGPISGSVALVKQGSGTLIVDEMNDYSGGTSISAGTVQVGNRDGVGTLGSGAIANNGALVFDYSGSSPLLNSISGSGTLTQKGGDTLQLSGNNTFTGDVLVTNTSLLQLGNASALGTSNTTVVANGSTLDINGLGAGLHNNKFIAAGSGTAGQGAIDNSGASVYPAVTNVTLSGNATFGTSGGRWDLRATGSGLADPATAALSTSRQPYNLTKVGGNEFVIANATVDPALADIDIQQGIFQVNGNNTGLGNPANTLTIEPGATFSVYDTTNLLNKKIVLADTATFENTHGANTIIGPITLNGAGTFNIGNASSLTLNGALGGAGVLTKIGQLPLTLNGDGSGLTGGVNINVGTLAVNGKLGCGVTNQSTGTLMGSGTISGTVDTVGAVMPGASNVVGTLTAGSVIFEGGGSLYYDLGYDTTLGSGSNDLIVVNGDLTINSTTVNINPLGLLQAGNSHPYRLFNYTGSLIWNSDLMIPGVTGYTFTVDTNTAGQVNLVVSGGPPVWTGGSATTSNWSDPANWGGIPITANNLLYFAGRTRLNNNNDTTAGTTYGGLAFNYDAGAFVLSGNAVDLGGDVANLSTNAQTIDLGLTFSASRTLNGGAAGLTVGGGLTNTAGFITLTLAGNGVLTNLLYSADPNSMTNTLNVASNANWTLVDNPASTPIVVPWNLFTVGGTLNFGTASSAPTLTSTTAQGVPNDNQLGTASGTATFNVVNGTFTTSARFNTATTSGATATVNQVGGTFNVASQFQGCNGTGGTAYENLGGGTMNIGLDVLTNGNGGTFFIASRGIGILTVSNTGTLVCNTLDVSRNIGTTTGTVNLNTGGTIAARRVGTATSSANTTQNGSAATFNFNGGMLKARAGSATYFQGSTASPAVPITAIVKSGGAVIDSDTNAISILEPLQHDSTLGATLDGGLTKIGPGTLTLAAANTYTGPTLVNAGTLAVNGSLAAGEAVTVNSGGTLGGTGTCGGNVTVNSGGIIAPGNSIGTLTVWSNVFLQAGSTTLMEINRGPTATNDVLRCTSGGTITLGGTLVVTNVGPALQSGDTFTLFSGTLSGSILPVLPPLWPGLSWNTSSLNSLGWISVTGAIIPPSITGASVAGGYFTLSGSGGLVGATYYVVASTNAALPLSGWVPVATNTFDASGNINLSIAMIPAIPGNFYRIQVP